FLFLGIPGAILCVLITGVIGAAGASRRRKEQALLRVRGATPGRIIRLAAAEAAFVGIVGSLLGLGGALLAGRAAFSAARFGPTTGQSIAWGASAFLLGLAVAFATLLAP